MWAVFYLKGFWKARRCEVVTRHVAVARQAIVARQAGKKLANGEALTDSEGIEKVRKRVERKFDEKRV